MRASARRLLYTGGLVVALRASQHWWRVRTAPPETVIPATPWPPVPIDPGPLRPPDAPATPQSTGAAQAIDGRCPEGHPVKAKVRSMIYHLPGMALYDRTTPDLCFRSAEDAEAGGFRRAKH